MSHKNTITGIIQISLGSLGFGFLGIFGKWAYASGLSVGELLTYRFLIAALVLWVVLFLFQKPKIRLSRPQILISAGLGLFGYAIFASLYFLAIRGMSVGLAALLLYTYPFWVSFIGHFILRDRMSHTQWLLLMGAFIGVCLLLWGQFHVHNSVALLAGLGSAITYAIYILVSARYQKSVAPISSSLYVITFAALGLAVYHQPNLQLWNVLSLYQWKLIIGISIISTIFPMTLILAGLQRLRSSQAALISMMEPVTATLAAGWILHERMTALQTAGATIVITCLILSVVRKN